jgi:hypothetical protein
MTLPSDRNNTELTYHRFIAGVAVGISSTVNPLYVSENAPRGIRGLLTGFYQLSIVTGLTVNSAYKLVLNLTNSLQARLLDQLRLPSSRQRACTIHHPTCLTGPSSRHPFLRHDVR